VSLKLKIAASHLMEVTIPIKPYHIKLAACRVQGRTHFLYEINGARLFRYLHTRFQDVS
jgi:hypothetical protein